MAVSEQRNVQVAQKIEHARLHQALWRQVEHLHLAAAQAPGQLTLLLGVERGVQRSGRHPQFIERGDLIVHQCDQRRHHHGQAWAQQPRHLETQRLAATCGHQHQGIATIGYAFDDRCLAPSEAVVTEDVLENALSLFEHVQLQKRRTTPLQAGRKTRAAHAECVSGFCQGPDNGGPLAGNRQVYRTHPLHWHRCDGRVFAPLTLQGARIRYRLFPR